MEWRREQDRSVKVVQLGGDSIPVAACEGTEGSNSRERSRKEGQSSRAWQMYRDMRQRHWSTAGMGCVRRRGRSPCSRRHSRNIRRRRSCSCITCMRGSRRCSQSTCKRWNRNTQRGKRSCSWSTWRRCSRWCSQNTWRRRVGSQNTCTRRRCCS